MQFQDKALGCDITPLVKLNLKPNIEVKFT